jgi:non-heme chloroperoxidase
MVVVEGGPHAIAWTHADKVNPELLDFLGQERSAKKITETHM